MESQSENQNKCPRCYKQYALEDKFCGFCGFNLSALPTAEMITQRAMRVSDIQFNLGMVYFNMGKYEQALQNFEKCIEESPDNLSFREMYEKAKLALKDKVKIP
ncbi:MAG: tetratricopeptide repeat protein [bacterium]